MKRKGITPVIAVVLLIAVTVAGSATIYEVFSSTQDQAQQFEPEINLNSESLRIESCWGQPDNLKLSIRNDASQTINSTNIPFQVDGEGLELGQNYSVSQDVVDPQGTFTATLTPSISMTSETRINILTSTETIEYRCMRLPPP
ncbi:archaellin/type IV pilin N-terminal domain-containing protein [Candidatus Nanosalina sp. VS9-1]|uniref:archaellin/type IV pilin N-terminal domain-containing protein n=1 Tax=Candidatus Nanosalina sp. VS9-1 TaxID=3388566 RepID=UPI0039E1CE2A